VLHNFQEVRENTRFSELYFVLMNFEVSIMPSEPDL
jgi:hypothetical protein